MPKSKLTKKRFDAVFAKWEKAIKVPEIAISSNPKSYTDIKQYKDIVKLGKEALPFVLEKVKKGVFFMNEAALKLSRKKFDTLVAAEKKIPLKKRLKVLATRKKVFLSEQDKSKLILKHIKMPD